MKKFFASVLLFMMLAACAEADPKITFNVYKCLICDRLFQSFPGDNLDAKDFKDKEQLRRVFRFSDRGKNLQECKNGFKSHVFEKKGSNTTGFSSLANSSAKDVTAVIRDGGS
ncbi:MAG: hypothetical protein IJP91_04280, partial [Synergistaceae bacterium]|nr:hypothetical protein [Synergistaceae bacterium]